MMSETTKVNLQIVSQEFEPESVPCLSFSLDISLLPIDSLPHIKTFLESNDTSENETSSNPFENQESNQETTKKDVVVLEIPNEDKELINETEAEEDLSDFLEIKFNSLIDLPEAVKLHIEQKIGNYEINKDLETGETSLIFEVNFNRIDKKEIWSSYRKFFQQKPDLNTRLNVSLNKGGTLEELLSSFKSRTEIPLVLHLLEKARLKVEIDSPAYLLRTSINYLKEEYSQELGFLEFLIDHFAGLEGTMKLGDLENIDMGFWRKLDLDQTQNFGGFFDVWRTPVMEHIFGEGLGSLTVTGSVFKFFRYEMKMEIREFKEFLRMLKEAFN